MPFCPGCGVEVIESAEICPKCGTRVGKQKRVQYPRMPDGTLVTCEKSEAVAVILGLLIPGAGVMYGGKIGLGVVVLLTCWLVVPWIYGIWKGYSLCKLNNILWRDYLAECQ